MHLTLGNTNARLRKPEPTDIEALFVQKNDPEVTVLLGGPPKAYSRADLARWIEYHSTARDEALFVITDEKDACLGHVGLYQIDQRARSAEFAIMLGERRVWGKGIGRAATLAMVGYGFIELQLHRVYLDVLESNERARKLYESIGFVHEGRLRHAQWKAGRYQDVHVMAILEDEWRKAHAR